MVAVYTLPGWMKYRKKRKNNFSALNCAKQFLSPASTIIVLCLLPAKEKKISTKKPYVHFGRDTGQLPTNLIKVWLQLSLL